MAIQISERTCLQPCSAKVTWTHTVAPDTLLDEVCSHGLREANHSRLGCAVHTSVHNSCLGRKNSIIEGIKNIVPFRMGTRINVLSDHCHTSSHSTLSKDWYQVFFLNSASYFLLNSQIHLCQIVTLSCTAILDLQLDFSLGPDQLSLWITPHVHRHWGVVRALCTTLCQYDHSQTCICPL